MADVIRAALVQTSWTGDKESMIKAHEEYARQAAEQGARGDQTAHGGRDAAGAAVLDGLRDEREQFSAPKHSVTVGPLYATICVVV